MCPGAIEGSALDGLRSRVAVSVRRVLDSCKKQLTLDRVKLPLRCMPPGAEAPLTFESAASVQVDAPVSDLTVARLEERPCFARVKCAVTVPVQVAFTDAGGAAHTAKSEIRVPADIVMYVPEASVFPFEVVAAASCNCPTGAFETPTVAYAAACVTLIIKIVADTDLLLPTYGYCAAPDAVDFDAQVCNKFFELPLYPSGK